MENFVSLFPWFALFGFFGLLLKVRVSGDPALWKRIKELEEKMDLERKECDTKIEALQAEIHVLQQQAFGYNEAGRISTPLKTAFRPDISRKDQDLINKLKDMP